MNDAGLGFVVAAYAIGLAAILGYASVLVYRYLKAHKA